MKLVLLLAYLASVCAALTTTWNVSVPFAYNGTVYKTFAKVIGFSPFKRPVLVLHGGPGLTHDYTLPHVDLASSRRVVFYDQIGNGRSSRVHNQTSAFWSVDLFLSELNNVIRFLGIQDDFDIVGHSWGGMLGAEFALRKPKGLKHLVLADSLPAMRLWVQSQMQLASEFPESVQQGLAAGWSNATAYRAAMDVFNAVHGCKVKPVPQDLVTSFDYHFDDPTVAIAMSKPLQDWDIIDKLNAIQVPVLVINGAADIAQDFVVQPFLDNIRGSVHVKFLNSSHTPMFEERKSYINTVRAFLDGH